MRLYTDISPYYDEIFPVQDTDINFIANLIRGDKTLLDVGCATGNKTELLKEHCGEIVAIDLDTQMISLAQAEHSREGITYYVLDMAGAGREFSDRKFEGVLCLGNTLVHLASIKAISDFLRQSYKLLEFNGHFTMQILNYDRILNHEIRELPLIETENLIFRRKYPRKNGKFFFQTELELKKEDKIIKNQIELYPLRKKELCEIMEKIGFRKGRLWGDFSGADWNEESDLLILHARK